MRNSLLVVLLMGASLNSYSQNFDLKSRVVTQTTLIVLGTAQDAGSPQINCKKVCCQAIFEGKQEPETVVALGVIDPINKKQFLFEATPDITIQLRHLKKNAPEAVNEIPSGIFITHAHVGHYTGLMYLGKEAMNAQKVPLFVYPKMKTFLEQNGPWSQLIKNENVHLKTVQPNRFENLSPELSVQAFQVPHRDEFSETVGYQIKGTNKSVLFIPDIDKWQKWKSSIIDAIKKVDYAFIDATFFSGAEIKARDIAEIPHPFVIESIELFRNLPITEKNKIHFIHMNHTNPLLKPESKESKEILNLGYHIARTGDRFTL